MRTLSSWEQLLATTDASGIQIQQYADGTVTGHVGGGEVRLRISTDYPWDGHVTIDIEASPVESWTLSLRRPGWTDDVELTWPAGEDGPATGTQAELTRTATWRAGDRVELDLTMTPRITRPHPRIDAVRGALAIERGPLVYCVETADLPPGAALEDIRLALEPAPTSEPRADLADGFIGVVARGSERRPGPDGWPYATEPSGGPDAATDAATDLSLAIRAIPYLAWSNRGTGGMRVWIPGDDPPDPEA